MTFTRIALAILAVPFAWRWGPALLSFIAGLFPLLGALVSFLMPDFGSTTIDQVFRFLISLVLFWFIFRGFGFAFGFLAPVAQSFSTTKTLRRFQGLCAELLLIGVGFVLVNTALSVVIRMPVRAPVTELEKYMAEKYPDRAMQPEGYGLSASRFAEALHRYWFGSLIGGVLLWLLWGTEFKGIFTAGYSRVLRFLHLGRFGLGGSARFAGLIEEWALYWPGIPKAGKAAGPLTSAQLFMGRSLYSPALHIGLQDDRHMLTIGGSRSGKGVTCIIPNLLTFEGSVLCIDPKGTNAIVTARRRREMGQAVYIVDPFHIVTDKSDSFNPLEMLDPNSTRIREALSGIADALVVHDGANKMMGSHWEDGARSVLTGFMAQLITDPKYRKNGPPTLPMIRDLLALKTQERAALLVDMSNNRGAGDAARDIAARMIRGIETEEITNIMSNADKHSEWLSYPSMRGILSSSTFRFTELKEKPTTIYLVVPPELLETHRRFLRLFINTAIGLMPIGGRSKVPVLFMLDEFLQLGKMASVERAFRLLAGYNFVVWPFVQELAGLQDLYGQGANAFLTNSRGIQVFGVNDPVTLEYVSNQIGQRSMQYVMGIGGPNDVKTTLLRTPNEVALELDRDGGLQYVLRSGKPAMVLDRVKYFERAGNPKEGPPVRQAIARKLNPFAGLYDTDPDYKPDV